MSSALWQVVLLAVATACGAPKASPKERAAARAAVRVTHVPTAKEAQYMGLDKDVPAPRYRIDLVNPSDTAVWFVLRGVSAEPRPAPEDRSRTLRAVPLRARVPEDATDVQAFTTPDGHLAQVPAGQEASLTVFASPWFPTQFQQFIEVWSLSALTFDGAPAEAWIADLPPAALATPTGAPTIDRVDLQIADRWEFRIAPGAP